MSTWLILGSSPTAEVMFRRALFEYNPDVICTCNAGLKIVSVPDYYWVSDKRAIIAYADMMEAAAKAGTVILTSDEHATTHPRLGAIAGGLLPVASKEETATPYRAGGPYLNYRTSGGILLQFALRNDASSIVLVGFEGYMSGGEEMVERFDGATGKGYSKYTGAAQAKLLSQVWTQHPSVQFIMLGEPVVRQRAPNLRVVPVPYPLFVSYATVGPYEEEMKRLKDSAAKFRVPLLPVVIADRGAWRDNASYKPEFLLSHIHDGPLVWIDADAEIVGYPVEFLTHLRSDIAAYKIRIKQPGKYRSGTVFINSTSAARAFLLEWQRQCEREPNRMDHLSMTAAIEAMGRRLSVGKLSESYVHIADHEADGKPVIVHYQASRRHRR